MDLVARVHEAEEACARGELDATRAWLREIQARGAPAERALLAALTALLTLHGDGEADLPPASAEGPLGSTAERLRQRLACVRLETIADPSAGPLLACWRSWLEGEAAPATSAERMSAARAAGDAAGLVDATSLHALHLQAAGESAEALATARRASRMARTEARPHQELLANLTLARMRRYEGRPQLALRILGALAPHAPPPWRRWLRWEATMAGGRARADGVDPHPLAALAGWLGPGEAPALPALADLPGAFRWEADQALRLRGRGDADAWRRGETHDVPPPLAGLAFREGDTALVVAAPDRAAVRVIPSALDRMDRTPDVRLVQLAPSPRVDAGIATLLLAPSELSVESYFERVYGFAYDAPTHRTMFNMHVKRMRDRLGTLGTIERDNGVSVRVTQAFVIRDPRCAESVDSRVLRTVAARGALDARSIGRHLTLPLRTVQRVLQRLQEDADLVQVKEGRRLAYTIEDTTFSEPTRSRRFPGFAHDG